MAFPTGTCIFAANGTNLKITSVNKPMFDVKSGHCELRQLKAGSYQWNVNENTRKRTFNFKANKNVNITLTNRDEQFTIIIKNNIDTTQLLGKLETKEECTLLMSTMERIKGESATEGKWLSASKENIHKAGNTKENTPVMTGVMERNKNSSSAKQPLRDQLSLASVIGRNSLSLKTDTTPTKAHGERVPLGDKKGPLSKNKSQSRHLPSAVSLVKEKPHSNVTAGDDDVKMTAYGGAKSSSSFYGEKTPEKPKIRRTYSRKLNNSNSNDTLNTTLHSWSFRERDDLFRVPKDNHTSTPSVVGFSNLGNTCYMNSILQCLLNIPTFFQDLNNLDNLELVQHHSLYNSLCNLGILKYSYESLENQRFALQRVKSAISNAAARFSGHAQHDAHELLCQCLDQLKEDLLSETKKKYEEQGLNLKLKDLEETGCVNCPIKSNFESTILHSITCEGCSEKVVKEEVCHDFSLVIPDFDENTNPADQSIADLLQMYFDHEMIEYSCEKCKGSYSVLSHHFSKLPRVLIIHIKRYDMNDLKKTDRICTPKSINLSAHVDTTTKSVPTFIYDKDKLKAKCDKELQDTLNYAEKRKSPDPLDTEPLQKHTKSSPDATCDNEINVLERDCLVAGLCEKQAEEDKENSKTNVLERFGVDNPDNDVDGESLARALNGNKFTEVKPPTLTDLETNTNGVDNPTVQKNPIEILSDEHDDNTGMGIYTSVSDDEEEELKRALDLSMKEYEKSQMESYKELESLHANNEISNEILDERDDADNEISNEILDESVVNPDNLYMLVGIVNHHGQNTGTGHYTSDSFDFKSKKWRCYNDSSVKEIKEYEVRFGRLHSAYIVFYMHNQCYQAILDGQ